MQLLSLVLALLVASATAFVAPTTPKCVVTSRSSVSTVQMFGGSKKAAPKKAAVKKVAPKKAAKKVAIKKAAPKKAAPKKVVKKVVPKKKAAIQTGEPSFLASLFSLEAVGGPREGTFWG
eukprot:CAMPEP_0183356380 /NCGR_PEP_ID=MMETSP0164_2-20130417/44195_1 /TAXON_ID=221442 /ORGANISM="Coccolithus pelagicus ssp braarudi, Strain PLY182g" /LENGTH=119 /DNA_ID=CAMNT_0025529781 /DNA_START=65 /DNA_END=424 /DNA_ORIENTATION=+